MSSHFKFSQATAAWHRFATMFGPAQRAWWRWQCRVSGFYYRHVTAPVSFWVACGQPVGFRPQLPWWQPFVFSYLRLTGWLRARRPERHFHCLKAN